LFTFRLISIVVYIQTDSIVVYIQTVSIVVYIQTDSIVVYIQTDFNWCLYWDRFQLLFTFRL